MANGFDADEDDTRLEPSPDHRNHFIQAVGQMMQHRIRKHDVDWFGLLERGVTIIEFDPNRQPYPAALATVSVRLARALISQTVSRIPGAGPGGTGISAGATERPVRVLVSGQGKSAYATSAGAQAGTHFGCLWDTTRRYAPLIGFHAQQGREPGRMGGSAAGPVPARAGG